MSAVNAFCPKCGSAHVELGLVLCRCLDCGFAGRPFAAWPEKLNDDAALTTQPVDEENSR